MSSYCEQRAVCEGLRLSIKMNQMWSLPFLDKHPVEGQRHPPKCLIEANSDKWLNWGAKLSGEMRQRNNDLPDQIPQLTVEEWEAHAVPWWAGARTGTGNQVSFREVCEVLITVSSDLAPQFLRLQHSPNYLKFVLSVVILNGNFLFVIKLISYPLLTHHLEGKTCETQPNDTVFNGMILLLWAFKDHWLVRIPGSFPQAWGTVFEQFPPPA